MKTFIGLSTAPEVTEDEILEAMENYVSTAPFGNVGPETVIRVLERVNFSSAHLIMLRRQLDRCLSWDFDRREDLQRVREFVS